MNCDFILNETEERSWGDTFDKTSKKTLTHVCIVPCGGLMSQVVDLLITAPVECIIDEL
jgi:molybdopterin/thiamine biosynthesis adenylyltransferase